MPSLLNKRTTGKQLFIDNEFFQAKFKRLSGTFSTERLGPRIRAGFFLPRAITPHHRPCSGRYRKDNIRFIADIMRRNII